MVIPAEDQNLYTDLEACRISCQFGSYSYDWIVIEQLFCDAVALPDPALYLEFIKADPTYATVMDLLVQYTQWLCKRAPLMQMR